jgi:hypothetical protein
MIRLDHAADAIREFKTKIYENETYHKATSARQR